MSKAIVEIPRRGAYLDQALEAARRVDGGATLAEADYHQGFANAAQLFAELTPARLALLDALQGLGPVTIQALARHLGQDDASVHADTGKLLELDRVAKTEAGRVWVPWEEIQIRVTLGGERAA